ncbi:histidine triad nucleotide-binding protein [Oceanicoccus sp. KOV_DT_Chl]|uniref:histidine triad nucleotide-binding protein n=1 Tax=Oceanicoccus sp. KOV_DT_Chl TaxID=1904639 RepID=UPI000C7C6A9B|nr:histidine triad nucleotide-binding protein [Oceanicoccus sp. KOV_DT_Chl]
MDCLFCAIAAKKITADIVYEDDKVVAFNDIDPKAPTHILVIPRKHIATINDMETDDKELLGHMAYTAKSIAAEKGFAEDGFRLAMNCNGHGGQTVFHIHLHMLGERQLSWPPG